MKISNMHFLYTLSVAALSASILLSGCAGGGQNVNPTIPAAVAAKGVTGSTYSKISAGQRLDYGDIQTLVDAGVPTHIIESYLQSTQASYRFSPAQIRELTSAGASSQLTSYLQNTGGFYSASSGGGGRSSEPNYERTNSPFYQDEQPFAYNAPEVDYWYNSAYEESLYSPFSFDGD